MDLYWPTVLVPAASRLEIIDSAGRFPSPLSGFTRTVSRPGERMRLTLTFQNLNGQNRAALQSFVAGIRGAVHRVLVHDHSNRIRGSFPSAELLSNNTFANGTTGWTSALGADTSVTAADLVLRLRRIANTAAGQLFAGQAVSGLTQYAPYALRVMTDKISGVNGSIGASMSIGGIITTAFAVGAGLRTAVQVALATSGTAYIDQSGSTNEVAGAYRDVPYASLARCALVDNRPNAMTQSDDIGNAAWTKTRCSISANVRTAPDGTITGDRLVEDTSASTTHIFNPATQPARTSQAEDLVGYGFFSRAIGTRDIRIAVGSDVANYSHCIFNLGAGTAGSVTNAGGSTNGRPFIVSAGAGWYFCVLVSRAPASATLFTQYDMINAGSNSYTGDGSSAVDCWRIGCARSSVPVTPAQTVATAAPTGTLQALAGGLYTKGWPASTNGLLLPGDLVQIGNQLLIVTAVVNSDAAGLAFLQFAPGLRTAATDNAPIIINQPMGKFFLEPNESGWSNAPGIFSDSEIVLAEAA